MKWVYLVTNKVEGTSAEESFCSYQPFSGWRLRPGTVSYRIALWDFFWK